jgi:acetyl esterase/lipase
VKPSVLAVAIAAVSLGVIGCAAEKRADFTQLPAPVTLAVWPGDPPAEAAEEQLVVRKHANRMIEWVTKVRWPTLTVIPAKNPTGAAIIFCPGGGYGGLAYDMEGTETATWFADHGVTGIVLKYRLPRTDLTPAGEVPWPVQDVQRAIRLVRSRAAEWGIDPARIGVGGYSAGGHLAATASTHVLPADPAGTEPLQKFSSRPDFSVLIYPVITFDPTVGHTGSANALIGKNPTPELLKLYCNDQQVTATTPPAFLIHAVDDPVKVGNSEAYVAALTKAGVPHEFMRIDKGGHGFGLGINGGEPATWPDRCLAWMGKQGLLGKP